jgi:hypothetical protein
MRNHQLFTSISPDFNSILNLKIDHPSFDSVHQLLEKYRLEVIKNYYDFVESDNYLFCLRAINLLDWHKDGSAFQVVYEIFENLDHEEDEVLSGVCSHYLKNNTKISHGPFLFEKWKYHFEELTEFEADAFQQLLESNFVNNEIIENALEMLSDPEVDTWIKGLIATKLNNEAVQREVKNRLQFIAPMVKYIESNRMESEYQCEWIEIGSAWAEKNFSLPRRERLIKNAPDSDEYFLIKILGRSDERTKKMIMDRYKRISDNDDDKNYFLAELKERNSILEREFLTQLPPNLTEWFDLPDVSDYQKEELIEEFNYISDLRATKEKKVKVGRNDPCPCHSGKKYKKCCLK